MPFTNAFFLWMIRSQWFIAPKKCYTAFELCQLGLDPNESGSRPAESHEQFLHVSSKGTHLVYTEDLDILRGL